LAASGTAGAYQFSSSAPFTFDPNHRAVAGDYDFIGLTENSFGRIMGGEIGGGGAATTLGPYYPLDLLRYAAPGVRALNGSFASHEAYFSIDEGVTNLHYFSPLSNNWDSSQGFDAFDAGGTNQTGHEYPLSQSDVIELDSIGYDYTGQPLPEPSTWITASVGALVLVAARVWRAKKHSQPLYAQRLSCPLAESEWVEDRACCLRAVLLAALSLTAGGRSKGCGSRRVAPRKLLRPICKNRESHEAN
jgi:hypothetical protein